MAQIISHPFRLRANGSVVTVDQESDQGETEQLAVLVMTRKGERPMAPSFGLTDPSFGGIAVSEIAAAVSDYGPPIKLTTVTVNPTTADDVQNVSITFEQKRDPLA